VSVAFGWCHEAANLCSGDNDALEGGRMLKQGEVIGVWVWGIVVWIILAFAFGDFWWFRPLYRQFF